MTAEIGRDSDEACRQKSRFTRFQVSADMRVLLRHKIAGLSGGGIDRTRDLEVEPFTCKSSNPYIRARIRLMPWVLVLLKQPR